MTLLDIIREKQMPSLINTEPYYMRAMDRAFREMDEMTASLRTWNGNGSSFIPACDIDESENEFHLTMDIPGLKKDDIQIEVVGNTVKISGERKDTIKTEGGSSYRMERRHGRFSRSFSLPEGIRDDAIEARYEHGVLNLTLPRSDSSKVKRISVHSD